MPHVVFGNVIDFFKTIIGFFQSLFILIFDRPDVVFAKGGFVSLPLGLATSLLRIRLVIHDSDMRPGLTNRVLSRYADIVTTGAPAKYYKNMASSKIEHVGIPISSDFRPIDQKKQSKYKSELGFNVDSKLVLVIGGSLGASSLNETICEVAEKILEQGMSIYLIAGQANYDETIKKALKDKNFRIVPFVSKDMNKIMSASDIIISRASSTVLQEVSASEKPVIAVPARQLGDQIKNATELDKKQAAIVISDDDLKDELIERVEYLSQNKSVSDRLVSNMKQVYKIGASKRLADIILDTREESRG